MEDQTTHQLIKREKIQSSDSGDVAADRRGRRNKSIKDLMEEPGTPTEEIISVLNKGTSLHKVRSLDNFYCRRYYVDLHNMRLHYSPSQKQYLCREVPYVDLCDLTEVRKGWNSDRFNVIESRLRRKLHASIQPKNLPDLKEDNCFSLIFDNGTDTIDLVAANNHVRDLWVKGLSYLVATCKNQQREQEYEYWLKKQFRKADVNGKGNLNFNEVLNLLNQLNISMHKKHAKALFDVANIRKNKLRGEESLDQDEFLKFYQLLISRPELDKLFKQYSVNNTSIMGPDELMNFLKTEQKMTRITLAECEAYIRRYEPEETQVPGYLSHKGFHMLLMAIDFDIFNRSHRIVCQDMSQPLSHYFIASSHNTYLLMGQLYGNSSIEAYRIALIKGCRCIELDVWDGEDGEPIIFHGYTLTSKIKLRPVLEIIQQFAFKTSQYPVILSMENHCSLEQQKQMASLMVSILGEYLYITPESDNNKYWSSPEELVRKILIKGKKLPTIHSLRSLSLKTSNAIIREQESNCDSGSDCNSCSDSADEMGSESDDELSADEEKHVTKRKSNEDVINTIESKPSRDTSIYESTNPEGRSTLGNMISIRSSTKSNPNDSTKINIAKEFSDITTCIARKFISFQQSDNNWKYNEMVSFVETESEHLANTKGNDYVKYNKKHLSRIYPKGLRTDSSNYNPIPHWNVGSQLVALNYQTHSKPMLFNDALFSLNGKCGYVLKAEFLRKGQQYGYSGRSSVLNSPTNKPKKVKLTIISGQHIPKGGNSLDGDIIDPYVIIKVYGHPKDKFRFQTKLVRNNGFNPIWDETCEFNVRLPEMAFIYFAVKDHFGTGKDITLGQYMLAFPAIMEGYRHVHLVDNQNQTLVPASIFVHISFKDIADYWSPE